MALNEDEKQVMQKTLYDCLFTGEEMQQNAIEFAEHMLYVGFSLLPISMLKDISNAYFKIYIKNPEKIEFDFPDIGITRAMLHGYFEVMAKVFRDRGIVPILRIGVEYKKWTREDALNAMRHYVTFKIYSITYSENLYAEIEKLTDELEKYTIETMYWCLAANETTKTYKDYPSVEYYMEEIVYGPMQSKPKETL